MQIITRKQAKDAGLRRYFTGVPCKRGHVVERYTSGSCVSCNKQWQRDNPDKVAVHNNQWREGNPNYDEQWYKDNLDKVTTHNRQWHVDHPDYNKQWYKNNKEQVKENSRQWQKDNPDKVAIRSKKWKKNNPDKVAANGERRNRRVRDAKPKWANDEAIKEIYIERDRLTKETQIKRHVHHIVQLQGKNVCGLHCEANLIIVTEEQHKLLHTL